MRLQGKRALVTAASSGIGKGVARRFVEEGAQVFITGLEEDVTAQTAQEIGAAGYISSDFTRPESVERMLEEVDRVLGRVDILFYNTGGPKPGFFHEITMEEWERGYRLILDSALRITRHVLPGMKEQGWGRLLYSTSSGVVNPLPLLHISNVMRAGVVALAKGLAPEVGPHGITTHVLAPAFIQTARWRAMHEYRARQEGDTPETYMFRELKVIPVKRFGRVEDIAAVAVSLASEEADYLTGLVIPVDGGFHTMVPLFSEVYTQHFSEEDLKRALS